MIHKANKRLYTCVLAMLLQFVMIWQGGNSMFAAETTYRIRSNENVSFQINIGGVVYRADTVDHNERTNGIRWLKFKIPEFVNGLGVFGKGLVCNLLQIDLTFPGVKVEVWDAATYTRNNVEIPSDMYHRQVAALARENRKPIAAVNGDFFMMRGSGNTSGFPIIDNRPIGIEVINGKITQTPSEHTSGLIIKHDNSIMFGEEMAFSGQVEHNGLQFPLSEINGFAAKGEMVLFNNHANSFSTDSAFAWSPYPCTMALLSQPAKGWNTDTSMLFKVERIIKDVVPTIPSESTYGGKDFNGEGAILVGSGGEEYSGKANAQAFLNNLNAGDEIKITTELYADGNKLHDKSIFAIGYKGLILENGMPKNTWNDAHPRTVFGYSQDGTTAYILVIDGRCIDYSVGTTTEQAAYILKHFGAYTGINLDGGGSSCFIYDGITRNTPSDGRERPVPNGIIVSVKK